jgi:hypothetical protein
LVRDARKTRIRREFFKELLQRVEIHMVNTVSPPRETNERIKELCKAR